MGKRFLDLHVHSSHSNGANKRADLEGHVQLLGTKIRYCDGKSTDDGLEISFDDKSDLKKGNKSALYLILKPLSKDTQTAAARVKYSIIRVRLNPALTKLMQKNNCAVEICLSSVIESNGVRRIRAIKEIKSNLKYARKYNVPMVTTTGAKSIYGLKSPYQVYELLKVLGFTDDGAKSAMYKNPLGIVRYGKEKLEKKSVSDYVRIL
jgi:RNase P/RNase MRP subunit p30